MLKTRTYLGPNSYSLQKPIGGLQQTKQQTAENRRRRKKETTGCWLVGLGDYLRGRRESVLKSDFSKPFHPTRLPSFVFFPPFYKALKASNHLLYSDNISNETLGFRASNMCLKSLIVMDLG